MTDKYDLSRFGLSYAGADPQQIAAINDAMEFNPISSQSAPEGYRGDAYRIDPMPVRRSRTLAGEVHPPLSVLDGNIHEDVIRRFYVEPEAEAHKRELDANRLRLTEDRKRWWSNQDGNSD